MIAVALAVLVAGCGGGDDQQSSVPETGTTNGATGGTTGAGSAKRSGQKGATTGKAGGDLSRYAFPGGARSGNGGSGGSRSGDGVSGGGRSGDGRSGGGGSGDGVSGGGSGGGRSGSGGGTGTGTGQSGGDRTGSYQRPGSRSLASKDVEQASVDITRYCLNVFAYRNKYRKGPPTQQEMAKKDDAVRALVEVTQERPGLKLDDGTKIQDRLTQVIAVLKRSECDQDAAKELERTLATYPEP
jgi:hypothetical protein